MLRHTAKGGLGAKKLIAAKIGLKHMEVSLFYRPPSSGDPHFYLPSRRHRTLSSPQFIAYTIIGTIPWTIFLVYTGEILGENWMLLLEYKIEIALISFLTAGIIAVAFYFWQKSKT